MTVDPRTVTISIPLDEAQDLSFGISDLLCWCRGFAAGAGPDADSLPMGCSAAREMNIKLKKAINEAKS